MRAEFALLGALKTRLQLRGLLPARRADTQTHLGS